MSLNFRQFELGILRPTLAKLAGVMPAPEVAVRLVGETLWHESNHLTMLGQDPIDDDPDGFGPGLGIASIEKQTWDWMWLKPLPEPLSSYLGWHQYSDLVDDLRLNVVACRLRYWLDPLPLPKLEDGVEARATYWWKVFNRGQVDRRPDYIRNAKAIPWVQP